MNNVTHSEHFVLSAFHTVPGSCKWMVQKMLELLVWIFVLSWLPLKAGRSNLKIYGLIFEKKEKFDLESLNLKFIIFQKSAMEFLI